MWIHKNLWGIKKLQINKIKGLINISNKAWYMIIGSDTLKSYNKKLYLVVSSSSGGKTIEKTVNHLKNNIGCQHVELSDDIMQEILNIPNCKIFGIKNLGSAKEIIKYIRSDDID